MIEEMTEAEYRRVTRLPSQIDRTLDKLDRLLAKAEAVGLRPANWAEHWETLRSRFLTDPKLIDREWEREVSRARNANGEDDDQEPRS
jgi:hypothetical protein